MPDPRNERWRPTGIQLGPAGIDGEYAPNERATAERLLRFLADRRVLFAPFDMEDLSHSVDSVLRIREFLTDLLMDWPTDTALHQHVALLRAACREFLDTVSGASSPNQQGVWVPPAVLMGVLFDGLGRLRTHFGYHIAAIMTAYELQIEDQLGVILPPTSDDDPLSASDG